MRIQSSKGEAGVLHFFCFMAGSIWLELGSRPDMPRGLFSGRLNRHENTNLCRTSSAAAFFWRSPSKSRTDSGQRRPPKRFPFRTLRLKKTRPRSALSIQKMASAWATQPSKRSSRRRTIREWNSFRFSVNGTVATGPQGEKGYWAARDAVALGCFYWTQSRYEYI